MTTNRLFLLIAALAVVGYFVLQAATHDPGATAARETADAAKAAENKRKGFHCLKGWDGSHFDLVKAVEASLRDPDSFEHVETRIGPINENGTHVLTMKYRARNGFGGMSVGTVIATVDNATCRATIFASE